ncbi:MAG: LysE family translocator [Pseudomonadota bacterium]
MILTPDVILLFVSASVALALAPGPDNIFVLTQSALFGRASGFAVILGLMTGVMVHTTLVAIGVAVIFQTSALAFTALKLAGAAYLIFLAWQAFRSGAAHIDGGGHASLPLRRLYFRGVIMNITNPKVAIFFLAFLPQFADPARGSVTLQILIFGALFALSALVVFGGVAWGAAYLGAWLGQSPKAQLVLNRMAGVVFLGLAFRLILAER